MKRIYQGETYYSYEVGGVKADIDLCESCWHYLTEDEKDFATEKNTEGVDVYAEWIEHITVPCRETD